MILRKKRSNEKHQKTTFFANKNYEFNCYGQENLMPNFNQIVALLNCTCWCDADSLFIQFNLPNICSEINQQTLGEPYFKAFKQSCFKMRMFFWTSDDFYSNQLQNTLISLNHGDSSFILFEEWMFPCKIYDFIFFQFSPVTRKYALGSDFIEIFCIIVWWTLIVK